MREGSRNIIKRVDSEIDILRKRNEELNWLISTNKELRVFKPAVIKTMFAMREDDVRQKEEDIEIVRLEHIQ